VLTIYHRKYRGWIKKKPQSVKKPREKEGDETKTFKRKK
jgi:hypothetical protein